MKQTPRIITIVSRNQIISNANALFATEVYEVIRHKLTGEIVYDARFQAPTVHIVDSSDFPIGQYEVIYQYDEVVQTDDFAIAITLTNLNKNKMISDPPIGGIVSLIQGRSHDTETYGLSGQEISQQIIKVSNNAIYYDATFPVPPGVNKVNLTNAPTGEYKSVYKFIDNNQESLEIHTFVLT
jgi:hypothetical protein